MYRGLSNIHQVVVMVSKAAHMLTPLNPQKPFYWLLEDAWELFWKDRCEGKLIILIFFQTEKER